MNQTGHGKHPSVGEWTQYLRYTQYQQYKEKTRPGVDLVSTKKGGARMAGSRPA